MKKLFVFIILTISFFDGFALELHKIKLKNTSVTVEGDRLIPVSGEQQMWEIDMSKEQEVFQLVSENSSKVNYKLNGYHVNAVPGGDLNTIPYKNDNKSFYGSAHLVLKKDSLPITISVDNKVIATFRLKRRVTYQKYSFTDKKIFFIGDTINVQKDKLNNTDVAISGFSISLKKDNNEIRLKDGIVTEAIIGDRDSVNCNLLITVEYADGKKDPQVIYDIQIKRKEYAIWKILSVVGGFIVVVVFLVFCIKRRRKGKGIGVEEKKHHSLLGIFRHKKEHRDNRNQSDEISHVDTNNINSSLGDFQVEHSESLQDEGVEVVIKAYIDQIKELKSKIKELENTPSQMTTDSTTLRDRIIELEESERAKLEEIDILSSENTSLKADNKTLQDQINAITSDNVSKRDLRNKIEELKGDKNKLIREKQSKERELTEARKTITSLETKVKEKDDKITETKKQKDEAESNLRIEKNTTVALQNKINSFSRQTYYLYAIDDTLQAVDNSLKSLFANVHDDNLMKRLAQPVLSGTAGLDAGLESYMTEWKDTVYNNQNLFFGSEVISMSDESVKEKLTEFLEQLALRDSFGKLVRLYLMTNVGWINEKMVEAGFDVDAIQTLFARFKNLFQLFNIDISYPHLFVDKFDSSLHKDNMRCEIFNYFEPSEELLKQLKNRDNENLIVDVTRIGIPNSKNPTRRNAMVSLPNF